MIQVKNNLTGAVGLFTTLTQAYKFFCVALEVLGMKPIDKKYFLKSFKPNKRFKVGFGNISIVVSEAKVEKTA